MRPKFYEIQNVFHHLYRPEFKSEAKRSTLQLLFVFSSESVIMSVVNFELGNPNDFVRSPFLLYLQKAEPMWTKTWYCPSAFLFSRVTYILILFLLLKSKHSAINFQLERWTSISLITMNLYFCSFARKIFEPSPRRVVAELPTETSIIIIAGKAWAFVASLARYCLCTVAAH